MNDRGFTLLEVMVALAILSGVLVTVLVSMNYHLGVAASNRDLVLATALGKSKAEEIKLLGRPSSGEGDFGAAYKDFSWKLREEGTEVKGVTRLELEVIVKRGNGVTLVSYIQEKQ